VNADLIAARKWPDEAEARSYDAAVIAERTRDALIERGESFVAETVFSHPSKVALVARAADAGYLVFLHVVLVPEELSVQRVVHRQAAGGHSVPEVKVRERYGRLWGLVAQAAAQVHATTFYDNSAIQGPVIVARLVEGRSEGLVAWPEWTPSELRERWSSAG
jgi:predicted ABC-type ATPase